MNMPYILVIMFAFRSLDLYYLRIKVRGHDFLELPVLG